MFHSAGPPAPKNPELREAINRFAAYIAKNGPQAEEAEKNRNYNNPRFSFLFNGEGATYYQFRLAMEINNLKQMAHNPPQPTPLSEIRVPPPIIQGDAEIETLEAQIQAMKGQINDSENNLKAHFNAMQDTKQSQTEKIYQKRESERIYLLFDRVHVDYEPFVTLIDHLKISGSKEAIGKCKHWIHQNSDTDQKREIVLTYLLHRCRSDEADGNLRLHILYLVNDWAYYCQRQKLENIKQMLSRYVPKMYAHATTSSSKITDKLEKLLGVWEKGKYFDDNCYKHLSNSAAVLTSENALIEAEKLKIGEEVEKELRQTYSNYQEQHKNFVKHISAQISVLQNQIAKITEIKTQTTIKYEERLIPKAPYYELPAGMIVPLIKPESVTFEPIDSSQLRLPAPDLLTDRLKSEVERFYSTLHNPSPDRFDGEGWEIKGLSEFYAVKAHHKRKLVEKLEAENKTFEDAITNRPEETFEQDAEPQMSRKRKNRSDSNSSESSSSYGSRSRSNSPKDKLVRSRSASPDERPMFKSGTSSEDVSFVKPALPLQREGNKGAQLLHKMGYSGNGGLGVDGQGIKNPIEVTPRHPQDQFSGIGSTSDEYDDYRKRQSRSFSNNKF